MIAYEETLKIAKIGSLMVTIVLSTRMLMYLAHMKIIIILVDMVTRPLL